MIGIGSYPEKGLNILKKIDATVVRVGLLWNINTQARHALDYLQFGLVIRMLGLVLIVQISIRLIIISHFYIINIIYTVLFKCSYHSLLWC